MGAAELWATKPIWCPEFTTLAQIRCGKDGFRMESAPYRETSLLPSLETENSLP